MSDQRTGLWKRCPRCNRMGQVFVDKTVSGDFFKIVWEGKARGGAVDHDIDTCLDLGDLLDCDMGCGYDGLTEGQLKKSTP